MDIDGRKLNITMASFGEVMEFKKVVSDALREGGIKLDLTGFSFDDMEVGDVGGIIESVLSVATNAQVRACLFKMAKRCRFGQGQTEEQITEDFFEIPENRQYYYPIMMEIARYNLAPFFGKMNSWFSTLQSLTGKFQKPGSQQT